MSSPAVLMGHSFGELAALNVAGCYDLLTGIQIVCLRVRSVAEYGPTDGGLLVTSTNRRTIAEEIAVCGLSDIVIAGRNHERQTIASGPRELLNRLRVHLQSKEIQSIAIPSPTSFHHPALRSAASDWYRQLQKIRFEPVQHTVFSPIGRRIIKPDDNIPAVLSSQFLRPFDLQGAIDDLVAGGTTRFVDCGSSGSLARLLRAAGPDSIQVVEMNEQSITSQAESPAIPREVAKNRSAVEPAKPVQTRIAVVGQGCLLPGRASSPAELHAALTTGRHGIVDQRQLDRDWERDFHSEELVPDRSTSALAGRVDDRDIVAPPGIGPETFAGFSRAQKILCVALAPCASAIQKANKVLCLVGATADGFQDQDDFAALRFAGVDFNDAEVVSRLGRQSSAFQGPYAAIQEVFDRTIRPGLQVTLIDAACASSLYTIAPWNAGFGTKRSGRGFGRRCVLPRSRQQLPVFPIWRPDFDRLSPIRRGSRWCGVRRRRGDGGPATRRGCEAVSLADQSDCPRRRSIE